MEEWRPVLDYEGLYEVSNIGGMRRVARGKLFTADQVAEAKNRLVTGGRLKDVAAFLRTSVTTVMAIKHGKTWAGDVNYRPLKVGRDKHSYCVVQLCKDGKYTHKRVHRCVWEAFNGRIPDRLEINHINLDREDNRIENLELLTHRDNVNHAHKIYAAERQNIPKGQRRGPRSRYAKMQHT
jgi:hypothetical protein